MKKVYLRAEKPYYKVNLHCHTTVSDGRLSPQEIKTLYKSRGYSAVAFTDHEYLVDHRDLTDDGFVALKGYEISTTEADVPFAYAKAAHFNLLAKSPDIERHVCYNPFAVWCGDLEMRYRVPVTEVTLRAHTTESMNYVIRRATEEGFLVTYNHPAWSLHTHEDYKGLEGLFAVEVHNHGQLGEGFVSDAHVYDDLLFLGKRLHCVCTDDNHNVGDPVGRTIGGWVNVQADTLSYKSLIAALEAGSFYSSTGPEIFSLSEEDNRVHVRTSPAKRIHFIGPGRMRKTASAEEGLLTEAVFDITDSYWHIVVEDETGKCAYTNAYESAYGAALHEKRVADYTAQAALWREAFVREVKRGTGDKPDGMTDAEFDMRRRTVALLLAKQAAQEKEGQ